MGNSALTPVVLQTFQEASQTQPGIVNNGTQSFSGDKTHYGQQTFNAPTFGFGVIPLGGVIASFPHLTGAYTTAATTTPDASTGFVLCQGQTLASGPMAGAVVPNINGQVFLRGNSTSGSSAVGSSSKTLVAGNIPQVSTSYTPAGSTNITHTHGSSSVSGTIDNSGTLSHTHTGSTNAPSPSTHDHGLTSQMVTLVDGTLSGGIYQMGATPLRYVPTLPDGNHTHSFTTDGSPSLAHNHTFSLSASGQTLGTTNVALSGTLATITVGNASPSSFDVQPLYINAVYLMRAN